MTSNVEVIRARVVEQRDRLHKLEQSAVAAREAGATLTDDLCWQLADARFELRKATWELTRALENQP